MTVVSTGMSPFPYTSSIKKHRPIVPVVIVNVLLWGCNSRSVQPKPTVQITQVPAANPGGPVQMDFIEGRANGAKPGQQIVLYAHLLQLNFLRKFNPIQRGGTRPIWAPIMRRSWLSPVFTPQRSLRRCLRRVTAWSQSLLRQASLLHRSFLRSSTLVDMTGECVTRRATEAGSPTPAIPRMRGPIRTVFSTCEWMRMTVSGHVRR
jgi:hypothetical protein